LARWLYNNNNRGKIKLCGGEKVLFLGLYGELIFRRTKRLKIMSSLNFFEIIDTHLDKFISKPDKNIAVFHEIESPDFHLDVYWIKPDANRNYTILMTNGVSSVPLKTPGKQFSKHIELCILLPSNWDLEKEHWKKPENFWPLDLLKTLGRYPSENNTWLGYGHSISIGKPIIGTKFTSIVLLKSKTLPDGFQRIKCGKDTIELYTLIPLYLEELNYKNNNGANKLIELFDEEDISDIINMKRKNVCKNEELLMNAKKPGLFQRLFGKPQTETKIPGATKPETIYDYSVLVKLAKIVTNGNEQAMSDISLLSEGVRAFVEARHAWCDKMDYGDFGEKDADRQEEVLLIFAYWLAGYPATDDPAKDPRQFGAYIDWKEETDDIIELLGDADKNLGYGLELDKIRFDYTEPTDKALEMTDSFLSARGLTLCALDTKSDSYHLFVLRKEEFADLTSLAERVGFRFYREFV
jgi:hypothetical protein